MSTQLTTDRLILRPWKVEDYEPFARMTADPEVMKYFPSCLSKAESDFQAKRLQTLIETNGWGFWAVELKNTAEFIGFVGLHRQENAIPNAPFIEIGWRLAKTHWRQGYATEAAKKALDFGFKHLAANAIYAFTPLTNIPSQKVMQKLGMANTQQDFDHPKVATNHPLARHCLYKITP